MTTRPTNVLLIDDEEVLLFGLKVAMKKAGYNVLTANNGADGLRMARKHRPDIIVCDVMMPPPHGFELREILSQDPQTASIPFIFLTARATQADKLQGIRAGADDYITKPFDPQELQARVAAVLRRAELGRQEGLAEAEGQMEQLRSEITKNVSHELRTPVSNVLLSLEVAVRDKFSDNAEEQLRFVETALDSAHRLQGLVDDLISLSLLDQGKTSTFRMPIYLESHFHEPIEQCLKRWQEKHLDVHVMVDPDVVIYAPRVEFKRAVVQLVDNAAKFSPEGGRIGIDLVSNGEGGCTLTVADEGPGIPVELREKVFERYYQASQGDARAYEGLGVGLTIARAFARALDGDVVILDVDEGCWVQMTIPGMVPYAVIHSEVFVG